MSSNRDLKMAAAGNATGSRVAVCATLAALVFAVRAWLVRDWGSPVPFWDEWDVEGALYHHWLTGTLHWRDIFAAHNEHRIALTRLADLLLFVANGGWNPWAQLLLNAVLHAATAALLVAVFWPALSRATRPLFAIGTAALFTATAGWQNALWGFQSQVYFSNLLAIAALAGLAFAPAGSIRWLPALVALLLGLFSNAAGLLAALAALVAAWRWPPTSRTWLAWFLITAVILAGFLLQAPAPQHASLHARSSGQFLAVLGRGLGWPHVDSGWAWLALQFPLFALCAKRALQRTPLDAAERCALALAVFSFLQAAAVAYARGAGLVDLRPLSRYQDPLLPGVAAQLFAGLRLATTHGRPARLALLGWSAFVAAGLLQLTAANFSARLPFKRLQNHANLAEIRSYLRTGDAAVFPRNQPFAGPHPNPAAVVRVLDDPVLHPYLPKAFTPGDTPPSVITHAPALSGFASFAFAVALALSLRSSRNETSCDRC